MLNPRSLDREGVSGEVLHQDMFHPDPRLLEAFDFVLSNGVVEHFEDPKVALAQLAAFLKPGGLVLTIVSQLYRLAGDAPVPGN